MSNHRDKIDTWLERDVPPLLPRPGSLDRIRRTARRRKATQAAMAAAGCAVVVAAAVAVPHLVSGTRGGSGHHAPPVAIGATTSPLQPTSSGAPSQYSQSAKPIQTNERTRLTAGTSATKPPPHFRPTSVTFAPTGTGGVVGAVVGQAGTAGHCATQFCTSLAGTSDYGRAWYGVSAPVTGGASDPAGVSQLRFADLKHGWAFGPGLWETSNGGWPWIKEDTYGMRVTDLEAASGRAFAIFARCAGSVTGQDFATGCTSFSLYTSVAGSATWTPVAVPAAFRQMTSPTPASASLVIQGTTGYLLTPSGQILRGPVSGGAWTVTGQSQCQPGTAQASGQPAGAQLATWVPQTGPTTLIEACDTSASGGYQTTIYTSADDRTWNKAGVVATGAAVATSLSAATPNGRWVLATSAGIYYSANLGVSWQPAKVSTGAPAGGFSYIGMTNAAQGVAVPAKASLGEVFVTANGGRTWSASPIKG